MTVFFMIITIGIIAFEQIYISEQRKQRKPDAEEFCRRFNENCSVLKKLQNTRYE